MIIIRRLKLVFQVNNNDCGIACLLTIVRYYKSDATREFLINASCTTSKGSSMYGLIKALNKLGFKAYGLEGKITSIDPKKLPVIAHVKIDEARELYHYVIISSIGKNKITIEDPSCGRRVISKEEFSKMTTNNYLFIEKTSRVRKVIKRKIIREELLSFFKKEKRKFVVIFITIIFTLILELINLFSLKIILNNAIIVKSYLNLCILLGCFGILLLLKLLFTLLNNFNISKLTCRLSYKLKNKLINQLLTLPILYYQTKERGTIISLFNDIDTLANFFTYDLVMAFSNVLLIIFLDIYFINLSFSITIILLVCSFILFIIIYMQRKMMKSIFNKFYLVQDEYQNELQRVIASNEKIKGLSLEKIINNKFKKNNSRSGDVNYQLMCYKEGINSFLQLFENLISLIILGIGGVILIKTNTLSLTTFILIENLIFIYLKNLENLLLIVFKFENYKKVKERLEEIFLLERELLLPFKSGVYDTKVINISITNLSFKYYDTKILDNLNLEIVARDKIFIYGSSGSGKSTLAKLLGRYLPLEYNKIKLNNIDLTHYNLLDLRKIVSYISLDDFLSAISIKDNIYLYRKPVINQNKLLKITGLKKMFSEKKYSLETILDEDGSNLSRGEKSRINLAQALLKPSEVYIFDECLSNVDSKLEREILENILRTYHDKIIIYISHRLVNKDLFNRVIYLKKGKCYESFSKKFRS